MQRGGLPLSVGPRRSGLAAVLDLLALPAAKVEHNQAFEVAERLQCGGPRLVVGAGNITDITLQFRVCYDGPVSECRQRLGKHGCRLGCGGLGAKPYRAKCE
jgi:hypothetical protein